MAGIPPRPPTGHIRCERVSPGDTLRLVVLSEQLLLVPYHGSPRGALLCPRYFQRRCRLCDEGKPARLERWAEALWLDRRRVVIQSFTEGAVKHCPALAARVHAARGLVVVLSRLASDRGGVRAEVTALRDKPWHGVPRAVCDVQAKVLSLYRVSITDLPGSLPLLHEADIESTNIPNVSEDLAAPTSRTTGLPNDPFPAAAEDPPADVPFGAPMPPESGGDHGHDAAGGALVGGCAGFRIFRPDAEASAAEDPGPRALTPEEIRNALRRASTRGPHGNNGQAM